jgi:hypothetical protein
MQLTHQQRNCHHRRCWQAGNHSRTVGFCPGEVEGEGAWAAAATEEDLAGEVMAAVRAEEAVAAVVKVVVAEGGAEVGMAEGEGGAAAAWGAVALAEAAVGALAGATGEEGVVAGMGEVGEVVEAVEDAHFLHIITIA